MKKRIDWCKVIRRISIVVILVCIGINAYNFGKSDTLQRYLATREFRQEAKKLNKEILGGTFRPRLNDEWFLVRIEKPEFRYLDSVKSEKASYFWDSDYIYVVLLNAKTQRVVKTWMRRDLMRLVNTNWGLSQCTEQIEQRLQRLENETPKK